MTGFLSPGMRSEGADGKTEGMGAAILAKGVVKYPPSMYVACMDDGPTPEGTHLRKVTVNLTERSWEAANAVGGRTGDTRTDVINRALQIYAWLQAEIDAGGELLIRGKDGDVERIRIV